MQRIFGEPFNRANSLAPAVIKNIDIKYQKKYISRRKIVLINIKEGGITEGALIVNITIYNY